MYGLLTKQQVRVDSGQGIVFEGALRAISRKAPVEDRFTDDYGLDMTIERILLDRRFTPEQVAAYRAGMRLINPDVIVLHEAPPPAGRTP